MKWALDNYPLSSTVKNNMFLKSLHLTNFRSYTRLDLDFDQRPTILVGDNAVGKSNLLEAIYLLSTAKSLRVETEDELIKDHCDFAKVEGFLIDGGKTELLVIINRQNEEIKPARPAGGFRKKVLVNGIRRRVTDFIGNLPAVIFHPSDINMVTGPPGLRRWHLDMGLAQIDHDYKKALTLYEQFLTARNKVLKRIREEQAGVDELTYWTANLVTQGQVISEKRKAFFEFINSLEESLGRFRFEYKPSEVTVEKLLETNGREVAAAATLIGPHRDDLTILLKDRNLARYGSRGEQRIATLAFKLAQLEYMAKILGQRPMLLLDDVFSELDAFHRAHVVEVVSKQQTIIATVELENIPKTFLDLSQILRVEDGKIIDFLLE